MTKKEIIITLAEAYVEEIKRDYEIYNFLKKYDTYIERESEPHVLAMEKIFDEECGEDFCSALCDFAYDGKIDLYTTVEDGKTLTVTCGCVSSIVDIYLGDK